MNTKSQQDKIIKHLQRGKRITRAQAMSQFGIANLPARICELRQDGHPVSDFWKTAKNQFGEAVKFKVYYMAKAA